MVIDASALLAVIFSEIHGPWCLTQLKEHAAALSMSTVNLSEVLIRVQDRQPTLENLIEDELLNLGIRFVPPTVEVARLAARARMRFPLNLGDCFAYALAKTEDAPLLTIDPDFRKCDAEVVMPG